MFTEYLTDHLIWQWEKDNQYLFALGTWWEQQMIQIAKLKQLNKKAIWDMEFATNTFRLNRIGVNFSWGKALCLKQSLQNQEG